MNLKLDFTTYMQITITLKGLTLKAIDNTTNLRGNCYKCPDDGKFKIDCQRMLDGITAQPDLKKIVPLLAELHEEIPFDGIKIVGYYPYSSEEVFSEILKEL